MSGFTFMKCCPLLGCNKTTSSLEILNFTCPELGFLPCRYKSVVFLKKKKGEKKNRKRKKRKRKQGKKIKGDYLVYLP